MNRRQSETLVILTGMLLLYLLVMVLTAG